MANPLERLKKLSGREDDARAMLDDVSSKLKGGLSKGDLQSISHEERKASGVLNQISSDLQSVLKNISRYESNKLEGSINEIESEIETEISDPGSYSSEVKSVERTLGEVENVQEIISLVLKTVEGSENLVSSLERDELRLLSEVEELSQDEIRAGADENVMNAAKNILENDKTAAQGTLQLFKVGREVAESLDSSVDELDSALTELEATLSNLQTKVDSEEQQEKIKELIGRIEDNRKKLNQKEERIENIDWDEIENDTLTLKERMEKEGSWEDLAGGMTNQVKARGDDVIKKFQRSKTQLFQALGNVPSGEFEIPTVEMRIQNEKRFRQIYSYLNEDDSIPVKLPEIKEQEGNIVRVEKVEGDPLNHHLEASNSASEQRELGRKVGMFVRKIHDNGIAITDFRINNFIVLPNGELSIVDVEYANLDASGWQKNYMDLITILSSARQVKPEAYRNFMDGFKSEYGDTGVLQKAIAATTSKLHAAALEQDGKRTSNALKNTKNSLKFWD